MDRAIQGSAHALSVGQQLRAARATAGLALLTGRWDYTDKGLLDRTHLRFFTLKTVCALLESADLQIEELSSTVLDPMAVEEVAVDAGVLPTGLVEWARHQPDALDYKYIAAARPLAPGEKRSPRPKLRPAIAYDAARLVDRHSEQMLGQDELRHSLLTQRHHVIGLEQAERTAAADQQPVPGQLRGQLRDGDPVHCYREWLGQRCSPEVEPVRDPVQRAGAADLELREPSRVADRGVAQRIGNAQRRPAGLAPLALATPRRAADHQVASRPCSSYLAP